MTTEKQGRHEMVPLSPISQLPTELLLLIMQDFVGFSTTLKNCSLVCRSWSYAAQRHLFLSLLLQSSDECNRFNDFFKNAPHLGSHVNNLTLRLKDRSYSSYYLNLPAAAELVENCGTIHTLEIDVRNTEWPTSGQDFVITKLKSVENLTVKGRISWDDLEELFYHLPFLRSVRILPGSSFTTPNHADYPSPTPSGTLYFSSPFQLQSVALSGIELPGHQSFLEFLNSSGVFDFSEMTSLKLGWLSQATVPGSGEYLDPGFISSLEEFFGVHGHQLHNLTLSGFATYRQMFESPEFLKFTTALGNLKNLRELKLSLSTSLSLGVLREDRDRDRDRDMEGESVGTVNASPAMISSLVLFGIREWRSSSQGLQHLSQLDTIILEVDLSLVIPVPTPTLSPSLRPSSSDIFETLGKSNEWEYMDSLLSIPNRSGTSTRGREGCFLRLRRVEVVVNLNVTFDRTTGAEGDGVGVVGLGSRELQRQRLVDIIVETKRRIRECMPRLDSSRKLGLQVNASLRM
jgi:hypothetical protein